MHDYKNQLSTIQTLIKNGHTDEALLFTQKLTESIAVEMSAINTNHPVVNAVLNQKYRSMQEKHIAVILKVGDLQEICLEEEEIVILLSNLLDNAIRESEKVLKNTGKAVIHLKLECEDHKLIFAIRNPVTEKVEIENDTIKSKRGDHHGIGLLNVKAVVDKYGGDMGFPAMKMNLRQWSSCKEMVFVCVIWSFDDMGLREQVILSDKKIEEISML